MKLGTSVFLLVIILIAFGYVLSDDHHIRKDLDNAMVQLEDQGRQMVDMNEQLVSCERTVQNDQLVIAQLNGRIESLNSAITAKDQQIASQETVIFQQNSRIVEMEERAREAAQGQPVTSANTWLQLDPVILAAILIVQLVWFVLQKRQMNGYVRLSPEERAHIIRMRRMSKV